MTATQHLEFRLDGKVALVTGGGSGIGRGIAEGLAAAGARVAICGRREEPLAETVKAIGGAERARAISGDVCVGVDRGRILDETLSAFGRLDILVNNAGGVSGTGPLERVDEESWQAMLDVNLTAPVLLSREAMPLLRKQRGVILNVSTGASLRPVAGFGAYASAKAGLNYASQVLALEAAPIVRVNVICPGAVETSIFETFLDREKIPEMLDRFREMTPMARLGKPGDVASRRGLSRLGRRELDHGRHAHRGRRPQPRLALTFAPSG